MNMPFLIDFAEIKIKGACRCELQMNKNNAMNIAGNCSIIIVVCIKKQKATFCFYNIVNITIKILLLRYFFA